MFTPIETSIGAVLLHQATSNLLYQNGAILGASGYLRNLLTNPSKETLAFMTGMAASFLPLKVFAPQLITSFPAVSITLQSVLLTVGVGVLIGWGTKAANGCTSGHMLCGLARLSGRSTAAVATFFPVALVTHHLVHPTLSTAACPEGRPCYIPVYPSPNATASLAFLATISILAARSVPSYIQRTFGPLSSNSKGKADARAEGRLATQFFSGLLFALGLQISQMSHPAKVTAFLSFPVMEQWDPSLALVILFGVLPNLLEIQTKGFSSRPTFAEKFSLPTKTFKDVDTKFVLGAAAFGVGWGLTGTCPGPAILRALAQPTWGAMWFGGFWLGGKLAQ